MAQSSLGYVDEEQDRADALPEDAQDRASGSLRSPKFQLAAPEPEPPPVAVPQPRAFGTPLAGPLGDFQAEQPEAEQPAEPPADTSEPARRLMGADSPEIGQAIEGLNQPPPSTRISPRDSRFQEEANRLIRANEAQKSGIHAYLASKGLVTDVQPDGTRTIATHEDGAPMWKPARSQPFTDPESGRPVVRERDDRGNLRDVDLFSTRGIVHTDPQTGARFYMGPGNEPVDLQSPDPNVARMAEVKRIRSDLFANEQLAVHEEQRIKASMADAEATVKTMDAMPAGAGEYGEKAVSVAKLKNILLTLGPSVQNGTADEDSHQRFDDATNKLARHYQDFPEHRLAEDAVAGGNEQIAAIEAARQRDSDRRFLLRMDPNSSSAVASLLPAIKGDAQSGEVESAEVAHETAASAAQNRTTQSLALPRVLAGMKASGVQFVVHAGVRRPIDDAIAEARNPPKRAAAPVVTAPEAPGSAGFLRSAGAEMRKTTYETAATAADTAGHVANLQSPLHADTAFLTDDQGELDTARKRLGELMDAGSAKVKHQGVLGTFTAGLRGEAHGLTPAEQSEQAKLITKINRLTINPGWAEAVRNLQTEGADSFAKYDISPEASNPLAKMGRGAGAFLAIAPTLSAMPLSLAQMAGNAYEEKYAEVEKKAAADADPDEVHQEAQRAAMAEAVKQAPQLLAYTVGGKLASAAVGKLMPAAGTVARGLAGAAAATAANVSVGAVTRAANAEPGQRLAAAVPNLENLTMDSLFGAVHGVGEAGEARARNELIAKAIQATAAAPKAGQPADPAQQTAADFLAKQDAKLVARIEARMKKVATQAAPASQTPGVPQPESSASGVPESPASPTKVADSQADGSSPSPEPAPTGPAAQAQAFSSRLHAADELAPRIAALPGDDAGRAALSGEMNSHQAELHKAQAEAVASVPEPVRNRIGEIVGGDAKANEQHFAADPEAPFEAAHVGAELRDVYQTPEQQQSVDALTNRMGEHGPTARFIADQHTGMLAAKDLLSIATGRGEVAPERVAELGRLGLVDPGEDGTPMVTHDALPLLPKGLTARLTKPNANYRVKSLPGETLQGAAAMVRGGQALLEHALHGRAMVAREQAAPAAYHVRVEFTDHKGEARSVIIRPKAAGNEQQALAEAMVVAEKRGMKVTHSEVTTPEKEAARKAAKPQTLVGKSVKIGEENWKIVSDENHHGYIEVESPKGNRSWINRPSNDRIMASPDAATNQDPLAKRNVFTKADPTAFTPEERGAMRTVMNVVRANAKALRAMGIEIAPTMGRNSRDSSGLAVTSEGRLLLDGRQLRAHFDALGSPEKVRAWIERAVIQEEGWHRHQFRAAEAAGIDFKKHYADILKEAQEQSPEMVQQAAETYEDFDHLDPHEKGAEIERMVLQGKWHGTLTEGIFKSIERILAYLRGLKIESPLLRESIARVEAVRDEAVKASRQSTESRERDATPLSRDQTPASEAAARPEASAADESRSESAANTPAPAGRSQDRSSPEPATPAREPQAKPKFRFTPREVKDGGFSTDPAISSLMEDGILSREDAIKQWGKEKFAENKGEFEDAPDLPWSHGKKLFKPTGQTPDEAAQKLVEAGLLPENGSVADMWRLVRQVSERAVKVRDQQAAKLREERGREQTQKQQDKAFATDTAHQGRGKKEVTAWDVNPGDHVLVGTETMKVMSVDAASGSFVLEDGKKYGTQEVEGHIFGKLERADESLAASKANDNEARPFKIGSETMGGAKRGRGVGAFGHGVWMTKDGNIISVRSDHNKVAAEITGATLESANEAAYARGMARILFKDSYSGEKEVWISGPKLSPQQQRNIRDWAITHQARIEDGTTPPSFREGDSLAASRAKRTEAEQRDFLTGTKDDPFNLAGETGVDHGKRAEEKARAEQDAQEARAKQEREQMALFASKARKIDPAEVARRAQDNYETRNRENIARGYTESWDKLDPQYKKEEEFWAKRAMDEERKAAKKAEKLAAADAPIGDRAAPNTRDVIEELAREGVVDREALSGTDSDARTQRAGAYFAIGHDAEGGMNWIYDPASRSIKAKEGGTHGSNFGHDVADRSFKGWYDPERNVISVVFPAHEERKLDHKPTVNDIPASVYDKLRAKFGKNTDMALFASKASRATPREKEAERLARLRETRAGFAAETGAPESSPIEHVLTKPEGRSVTNAYHHLVSKTGFPAVSIAELADQSGVPLDKLKAQLLASHRAGNVVFSKGDWSLASDKVKSGAIQVPGQERPMLQVRWIKRDEALAASRAKKSDEKNLVAVHNLSLDNLRHAVKVGGLAVPSMAIIRADRSHFDNFGDVTLVAHPDVIDPQKNRDAKTFNADVYSPRYPKVTTFFKEGDGRKLSESLDKYRAEITDPSYSFNPNSLIESIKDRGIGELQYNTLAQYAYAREHGMSAVPGEGSRAASDRAREFTKGDREKIGPWIQERMRQLGIEPVEKIFNGFTNMGNRRYLPHDLDTVVKLMKKELRGGEGFNYGVGSIRAQVAKQFKTLRAIQESRDSVVPKPEMDALKKEIDDEFMALETKARAARKDSGSFHMDSFADDLIAMAQGGSENWRHLREMYPNGIPPEMGEFLQKLKGLPTEYFETKVRRAVQLHEFAGAVVPEGAPADVVDQLKRRGLDVQTYTDSESRKAAIANVSTSSDALFASKANRDPVAAAKEARAAMRETMQAKVEATRAKERERAAAAKQTLREKSAEKVASLRDKMTAMVSKVTAYQETLRQAERAGAAGVKRGVAETRAELDQADRWFSADMNRVKDDMVAMVKESLPPEERGHFIAQIASVLTDRPGILRGALNDATKPFRAAFKLMGKIQLKGDEVYRKGLAEEVRSIARNALDSPSVDINYKAKLRALIAQHQFAKLSPSKRAELESRRAFVSRKTAAGEAHGVSDADMAELKRLDRPHISEITAPMLEALRDKVQLLKDQGELTVDMRALAEQHHLRDTMAAMKQDKGTAFEHRPENADLPPLKQGETHSLEAMKRLQNKWIEANNKLAVLGMALQPMDPVFDILGHNDGSYQGFLFRHVRGVIDDDYNMKIGERTEAFKGLDDIIAKHKLTGEDGRRIGVLAAANQEGGRARLVKAGIPEAHLDKIITSLTPGEREAYQYMRDAMDARLPELRAIMRELYNEDVIPVENYFPMIRDWHEYAKTQDLPAPVDPKSGMPIRQDELATWRNVKEDARPTPRTNVEKGFSIKRLEGAATPIRIDAFEVWRRHMDDVLHLIHTQRDLRRIGKVLRSDEAAAKYGRAGRQILVDWLDTIARNGGSEALRHIGWLDWLRQHSSVGMVGYRLVSQLKHASNAMLAMHHVGLPWYTKGLTAVPTAEAEVFLRKNMAETFDRHGGEMGMEEIAKFSRIANFGFAGARALDRYNAQAVALGSYFKAMVAKGYTPAEALQADVRKVRVPGEASQLDRDAQTAVQDALVRMRRVVASAAPKDAPQVLSRGTGMGNNVSVSRTVFQFGGIFLDRWSNISHDFYGAGIKQRNFSQASTVAFGLLAAIAAESLITVGVRNTINTATGSHPKEEETLTKEMLTHGAKQFPFVGPLVSAWQHGGTGIPLADAGGQIVASAKRAYDAKTGRGQAAGAVRALGGLASVAGVPGAGQGSDLVAKVIGAKEENDTQRLMREGGIKRKTKTPEGQPARKEMVANVRGGTAPREVFKHAVASGVKPEQARSAVKEGMKNPSVVAFERLPLPAAIEVYKRAVTDPKTTPELRLEFRRALQRKHADAKALKAA